MQNMWQILQSLKKKSSNDIWDLSKSIKKVNKVNRLECNKITIFKEWENKYRKNEWMLSYTALMIELYYWYIYCNF